MRKQQPNFERVLSEFYSISKSPYTKDNPATMAIIMERVYNPFCPSFHNRSTDFYKELGKWCDTLDIRQAGTLIDLVVKLNGSLPSWIKNKKFSINYNKHGMLDLIQD